MKMRCCFCGKEIDELQQNNPEPVKSAPAVCCDDCNFQVVIPARMNILLRGGVPSVQNSENS